MIIPHKVVVSNTYRGVLPRLQPLGDFESYRFAEWRNQALTVSDPRCASAIYSRPGETYLFVANLDEAAREVTCVLHPEKLPCPLAQPKAAVRVAGPAGARGPDPEPPTALDVRQLTGPGLTLTLPGDDAILIHVR